MPNSPIPDVLFLRPQTTPATAPSPNESDGEQAFATAERNDARPSAHPAIPVRDVIAKLQSPEPSSAPTRPAPIATPRTPIAATSATATRTSSPHQWYADVPVAPALTAPHLVAEVSPPANRRSVLDHPSKLGTHTAKPRATPTPIRWPATIDKIISQQGEVWPALTQHVSTSHVVGIVGLTPRCGATTLAIALVKALLTADPTAPNPQASDCRTRRNILLVDANFANPMIAPWFQLPTDSAWNEGSHSPLDSSSGKTLPGPAGLQILPLTCGIRHPRQPPPSATDPDEIQNSIRYYLPENAAGPMVRKLQDVLQTQRSIHQHVVADLGTLGFWANTGLLPTLATSCQQILFVVPKNFDNRIASQQYWQLQDAGCQAIAMLENTK